MTERLQFGRLKASLTDIIDAGVELLPAFAMAAIPVLDGADRPGEWPEVKRTLRFEGIRPREHRGVLLLEPGELDIAASVGLFHGADEVFLFPEWNDELESFPGRVSSDMSDFNEGTPLGLEEWVADTGCLLVLGDARGINFATLDAGLAAKLRQQFRAAS